MHVRKYFLSYYVESNIYKYKCMTKMQIKYASTKKSSQQYINYLI